MTDATIHLGLGKPTVGADSDDWGGILNADLDQLDALWINLGNVAFGTAAGKSTAFFAQASNNLSDLSSAAAARTNLGLGTAAVSSTGTSGHALPYLDGVNTWSAAQAFSGGLSGNLSGNASTASALTSGDKSISGNLAVSGNTTWGGSGYGVYWDGTWLHFNQQVWSDGNGDFNDVYIRSDARLKTDIKDAPDMGGLIDRFRVRTFRKEGRQQIGVIAQEVEAFMPSVVTHGAEPFEGGDPLKSITTGDVLFALLHEVQSLRRRVAELEARPAA